ncbi:MAG: 23S rRNA pseudouridine2605 synthase [Glaciecola sp.]|jgi:23S rRNA pseudouridine2605 synthase
MKKKPSRPKMSKVKKGGPKKSNTTGSYSKKDGGIKSDSSKSDFKKKFRVVRKDSAAEKPKQKKDDKLLRLNKYIAHSGICSRREADDLITAGVIKVNGKVVTELGTRVDPLLDRIHYEDQLLRGEKLKYVLLNKPKGFISMVDDPRKKKTVMDIVGTACKERIEAVGRMDRSTTGILLMTNDAVLTRKLTHPTNGVKRVFAVSLDKDIGIGQMRKLREGVQLDDGLAKVDKIDYSGKGKREVGVELHMGKNRIVRRMFESLGFEVTRLDQVMFAGLTKKNLPRGHWRFLDIKEIEYLQMS